MTRALTVGAIVTLLIPSIAAAQNWRAQLAGPGVERGPSDTGPWSATAAGDMFPACTYLRVQGTATLVICERKPAGTCRNYVEKIEMVPAKGIFHVRQQNSPKYIDFDDSSSSATLGLYETGTCTGVDEHCGLGAVFAQAAVNEDGPAIENWTHFTGNYNTTLQRATFCNNSNSFSDLATQALNNAGAPVGPITIIVPGQQVAYDGFGDLTPTISGGCALLDLEACCLPGANQDCVMLAPNECTTLGGTPQGPGSLCPICDRCIDCVPAVSEWGVAVMALLVLSAATILVRGRRNAVVS